LTNGNQLRLVEPQGTTVFTYDEENRLTGIGFPTGTSVEYQYDGQGRRLRMKDPNVEVFSQYGLGQVISDRDGAGAVIAYYVRGLGGRLISNVQTAGTRYYHFDGLGSVVALTDSAGAKVSSYTYDEFGVLKQSTGQSWNNFQYTSSIHDASPGLYLMGSRYYDPALGRFITQDTWGGNAYEPWTKNLYAYGRGNPIRFVDPTGHYTIVGPYDSDAETGSYTSIDLGLLALKVAYGNATTDEERAAVHNQAEQLRAANAGQWTVGSDKSLEDYLGSNGAVGFASALAAFSNPGVALNAPPLALDPGDALVGLGLTALAALTALVTQAVQTSGSAVDTSQTQRELFFHYTTSFGNAMSIWQQGLKANPTNGLAWATKNVYFSGSVASQKVAAADRRWCVMFLAPVGLGQNLGQAPSAVDCDTGQIIFTGGASEYIFPGGITPEQGFIPVGLWPLLP